MGLESMPDMHHSMIFSDRRSIEFFGKVSSAELAKSHLIISKVPMVDIIGITDLLFNKLQAGKVTYTINSVPTFRSMSESLLKKVLEENNVITSYSIHYTKLYEGLISIPNRCISQDILILKKLIYLKKKSIEQFDIILITKINLLFSRQVLLIIIPEK